MSPMDGERYTGSQPPSSSPSVPAVFGEAELAREYWERVRLFAARRLGDAALAEDVAQETIRRVLDALRAGRVESLAALPGFVFQTAKHICLQRHRSAGRESRAMLRLERGEVGRAAPDALSELIGAERREAVRRALERLASADRDLLHLLYYEQRDTAEIATMLGVTAAALRVRKHRAVQRLAELLGATSPETLRSEREL